MSKFDRATKELRNVATKLEKLSVENQNKIAKNEAFKEHFHNFFNSFIQKISDYVFDYISTIREKNNRLQYDYERCLRVHSNISNIFK